MLKIAQAFKDELEVIKFNTIPDLVRWAKKKKILDLPPRPKKYIGKGKYQVRMKPERRLGINPYTARKKKLRVPRYLMTDIPPEKRTLKNIPKDSNGKNKVRFQDWLLIKADPERKYGLGKSQANGKWYGWSHRAISSFNSREKAKRFADSAS